MDSSICDNMVSFSKYNYNCKVISIGEDQSLHINLDDVPL